MKKKVKKIIYQKRKISRKKKVKNIARQKKKILMKIKVNNLLVLTNLKILMIIRMIKKVYQTM